MRSRIGWALLLAQLLWVVWVHFGPPPGGQSWATRALQGCSAEPSSCRRYFAWAPNDYIVDYTIEVTVDGRRLASGEVAARYRYAQTGIYEAPVQQLIDTLRRYEQTYGRHDRARVILRYSINGRENRVAQIAP